MGNKSDKLTVSATLKSNGGPPIDIASDPLPIQESFTKWSKGLADDNSLAQAQKMTWDNWFELQEVQEVVNDLKDKSMQRRFTQDPPTTTIMNDITNEYLQYSSMLKQIDQTLNWECTKQIPEFKQYLYGIREKMIVKMLNIDKATEQMVFEIEEKALQGDFSFFLNYQQ